MSLAVDVMMVEQPTLMSERSCGARCKLAPMISSLYQGSAVPHHHMHTHGHPVVVKHPARPLRDIHECASVECVPVTPTGCHW